MNNEYEIVVADEKHILDEKVETFVDNIMKDGYKIIGTVEYYSARNIQWESLVTFTKVKGSGRVIKTNGRQHLKTLTHYYRAIMNSALTGRRIIVKKEEQKEKIISIASSCNIPIRDPRTFDEYLSQPKEVEQ